MSEQSEVMNKLLRANAILVTLAKTIGLTVAILLGVLVMIFVGALVYGGVSGLFGL